MKTKRISAPSVTEAMSKVKRELGPDAIILYTKKIKRTRWLPPFRKEMVEVVAALDEESRSAREDRRVTQGFQTASNPSDREAFRNLVNQINEATPLIVEHDHQPSLASPRPGQQSYTNPLSGQASFVNDLSVQQSIGDVVSGDQLIPDIIKAVYHKLVEIDFRPDFADRVVKYLLKEWYTSSNPLNRRQVREKLTVFFEEELAPFSFSGKRPSTKLITLVGPTGVGKTTTAAKLASKAVLEEEKSVALITTDTYRIAAVDQLKTYAKILNVPISVCYSMEDFKEALIKYQDVDLIIVDSAGRNYQQKKYVNELLQLIPFQENMETYLVLSATSKVQDLERITGQFLTLPVSNFLFTKLDETVSIGNLCQLILRNSYGVTYFTNGQDVPDDILEADQKAFIAQLIEGIIHE